VAVLPPEQNTKMGEGWQDWGRLFFLIFFDHEECFAVAGTERSPIESRAFYPAFSFGKHHLGAAVSLVLRGLD
jgi:hypothetical protein